MAKKNDGIRRVMIMLARDRECLDIDCKDCAFYHNKECTVEALMR